MKIILLTALLVLADHTIKAQNTNQMEKEKAEAVLLQYIRAVDAADVNSAADFLAPEFRVVLTHFQNTNAVKILSKDEYLGLMKAGKVGGKKRTATILLSDVHKEAALIKIKLESETVSFTNYYSLVNINEKWFVINDIPQVETKK